MSFKKPLMCFILSSVFVDHLLLIYIIGVKLQQTHSSAVCAVSFEITNSANLKVARCLCCTVVSLAYW